MPVSDFSENPIVQVLDDAIAAVTLLRENGMKLVSLDPHVWAKFCAPLPAAASERRLAGLPQIPQPNEVQPSGSGRIETPDDRQHVMQLVNEAFAMCRACCYAGNARFGSRGNVYNPPVAIVNGPCLLGDTPPAVGSHLEGEAGALLDKMMAAIGLKPESLYITPALKCGIPRGKADVTALSTCAKLLRKELQAVNPRAIVLLGPVAAQTLCPGERAMAGTIGLWHVFEGNVPMVTLHHPMRLILAGEALSVPMKQENWRVLQALRVRLQV